MNAARLFLLKVVWAVRRLTSAVRPAEARRTFEVWRRVRTRDLDVVTNRLRRAGNAARSTLFDLPSDGPIWAVTMVKNEEDIIGETILNLLAQGIDHVLVADNGSTDDTRGVLLRLAEQHPVHVVHDPIVDYWQAVKISHLARAATRMGASWIVPFDGDEVWRGTGGKTIAEVLKSTGAAVLEAGEWVFVPLAIAPAGTYTTRHPYREAEPSSMPKVAFRASWLARVGMGNHSVSRPGRVVSHELRIAHYSYRTPEQILRKASDGAQAAKLAGLPVSMWSQWADIAGRDEEDARALMAKMTSSDSLIFDPASQW